ncbi:MAG: hypothetical protein M3O70_15940 [Actinomycetota bacterium]|nr:hypothetical protein [Actinomycetota bacterium]
MGYRGKVEEQARARELRAEGLTLAEISAPRRVEDRRFCALREYRRTPCCLLLRLAAPFLRHGRATPCTALYLHEGLDLGAVHYWSDVTRIPPAQFSKPYRAAADPTLRAARHEHGCSSVRYSCSRTDRTITGLMDAMLAAGRLCSYWYPAMFLPG